VSCNRWKDNKHVSNLLDNSHGGPVVLLFLWLSIGLRYTKWHQGREEKAKVTYKFSLLIFVLLDVEAFVVAVTDGVVSPSNST